MKKNTIFTGAATAVITPLTENGVDYPAFEKLLNWQVEQGIDALVICGTTGEGSTLSDKEHKEVLQFALDVVAGRYKVDMGSHHRANDDANTCGQIFLKFCERLKDENIKRVNELNERIASFDYTKEKTFLVIKYMICGVYVECFFKCYVNHYQCTDTSCLNTRRIFNV